MNNELENMVVAYFNIQACHLSEATEEIQKKSR